MFKLPKPTAWLLIASLLSSITASAQELTAVTVTGIVTNSKGDPIGFATITAKSSASEKLFSTVADSPENFYLSTCL